MSIELAMPKLGLTMKTGKVSKWFVAEGAMVKQGDDLFEVETDKITNKVESPADGVLFQILVQPKQEVAVGAVLGIIAEPGENPARMEGGAASSPESAADAASPAAAQKSAPAAAQPPRSGGRAFSSPAARRLACELDVDIACVTGSGPEGRILERDVRARFDAVGKIKITPLAAVVAARAGLDIATLTGTGEGGKIGMTRRERLVVAGAGLGDLDGLAAQDLRAAGFMEADCGCHGYLLDSSSDVWGARRPRGSLGETRSRRERGEMPCGGARLAESGRHAEATAAGAAVGAASIDTLATRLSSAS